jgi:phytanoyl-CoA hydroxylase
MRHGPRGSGLGAQGSRLKARGSRLGARFEFEEITPRLPTKFPSIDGIYRIPDRPERAVPRFRNQVYNSARFCIIELSPIGDRASPMLDSIDRLGARSNLFSTKGYDGNPVLIPTHVEDTTDPYLKLTSDAAIKKYYSDNGYVVIRNAIPAELCERVRSTFEKEVKPYRGHLYRQPSGGKSEVHKYTKAGFVENSILNVHDLSTRRFGTFRKDSLQVLTHDNIQKPLTVILGEPGQLVQSMYFEGNPNTWPHQDTYYLDSEKLGSMVAVWAAIEDISPGAGRFYVYPGSHKIDMMKNGGKFDVAFNHDRYKKLMETVLESSGIAVHAPALRRGDLLFWNSKTIHGSLPTTQPEHSRSSFTGHYLPESHRFMQFQSRVKSFRSREVNNMRVNHPKDQDRLPNRLVLGLETRFPKSFELLKNTAIKIVTR